jgi:hypothetical protein
MRILEGAATRPTWNAEELGVILIVFQASLPTAKVRWDLGAGARRCLTLRFHLRTNEER